MAVFDGPAIQVPENPEPIFNPINGLAEALCRRQVSIAPLLFVEGGARIGGHNKQFSCTSQGDFAEIADRIAATGKVVRFVEMMIPKSGIVAASFYRQGNIWVRYIADYHCPSDQMFGRWDMIVEPLH